MFSCRFPGNLCIPFIFFSCWWWSFLRFRLNLCLFTTVWFATTNTAAAVKNYHEETMKHPSVLKTSLIYTPAIIHFTFLMWGISHPISSEISSKHLKTLLTMETTDIHFGLRDRWGSEIGWLSLWVSKVKVITLPLLLRHSCVFFKEPSGLSGINRVAH